MLRLLWRTRTRALACGGQPLTSAARQRCLRFLSAPLHSQLFSSRSAPPSSAASTSASSFVLESAPDSAAAATTASGRSAAHALSECRAATERADYRTVIQKWNEALALDAADPKRAVPSRRLLPYNQVMHALSQRAAVETMVTCYESMKAAGVQPDVFTYTDLIHALSTAGHTERMASVYSHMKLQGVKPDVVIFNALLNALALPDRSAPEPDASIDTDRIWRFYEEMVRFNIAPTVVTLNTLLTAFSRARRFERVEPLYHELIARHRSQLRPNERTFHLLIDAAGKCGDLSAVQRLLGVMCGPEHKLKPTAQTCNSVLDAISRHALLPALNPPRAPDSAPAPSATSRASATAPRDDAAVKRGLHVLESQYNHFTTRHMTPTVVTFTIVLSSFAQAFDLTRVVRFYRDMQQRAITPNARTFVAILSPFAAVPPDAASVPSDLIASARTALYARRVSDSDTLSAAQLQALNQFVGLCEMAALTSM
jgi:pentatricopeptide repeat protein